MAEVHPIPTNQKKHGLTGTKEYGIWAAIRSRCTNPKVTGYGLCGGVGITMDEHWACSFTSFLADVGPCPAPGYRLERLDRSKNYVKENVVWRKRTGLKTHGLSASKIYRLWHGMLERCYDKNHVRYHRYGGAGITVCERWHDFPSFLADMGYPPSESHSLDRKDNNGPYSPENCRWATEEEQANNKSSSRFITHDGTTLTLALWCKRLGIRYSLVHKRLRRGWSFADAISAPLGTRQTR